MSKYRPFWSLLCVLGALVGIEPSTQMAWFLKEILTRFGFVLPEASPIIFILGDFGETPVLYCRCACHRASSSSSWRTKY